MDWERIKCLRMRWRTMAGAGVIGFLAALQALGAVDVTPLVAYFVGDEHKVAAIMTLWSLSLVVFRAITTQELFHHIEPTQGAKLVDEGS